MSEPLFALFTEHDTSERPDWTRSTPESAEVCSLIPGRPLVPCCENGAFILRALGTHEEMRELMRLLNELPFNPFLTHLKGREDTNGL